MVDIEKIIEEYCINKVTQYEIKNTFGEKEKREFSSGCHVDITGLAAAIRKAILADYVPRVTFEAELELRIENILAAQAESVLAGDYVPKERLLTGVEIEKVVYKANLLVEKGHCANGCWECAKGIAKEVYDAQQAKIQEGR